MTSEISSTPTASYSEEDWEDYDKNQNQSYFDPPVYPSGTESVENNPRNNIFENIQEKGGNIYSDPSYLPDVFTKVSPAQWPIIYSYSTVFIVAAVGNIIEFVYVWRRLRKRSTAMNRLLLHLCFADIVVVFMVAAVEVFWRISIGWYAGDLMCK